MKFNELNLSKELERAVEDLGFSEATYIQSACIPIILNGGDVIGQSQTGTGKTAAFGLPLVEMLDPKESKKCKALILSPTRELALQVTEHIRKFAKYKEGIRTVAIYGGAPISNQIQELKRGCDIVVGTPGRVLDHIDRKTLRLEDCKTLILDEADEMLNMGFREDIESVINSIDDEKRQTILFSATMPKEILDITHLYQTKPVHVKTPQSEVSAATIEQVYYEVTQSNKRKAIMQLIQLEDAKLQMVFCNTKKMVDDLCTDLVSRGYSAAAIHGDMKQEMRLAVLKKFKAGKINILIATDVAARGIDIANMDVVFNYDFPQEDEYYIHRIGRCGRAGNKGKSITLITPRQRRLIKNIEYKTKAKLKKLNLPTGEEIQAIRFKQFKQQIEKMSKKAVPDDIKTLVTEISSEYTFEELAQVLAYNLIGGELFEEIKSPIEPNKLKVTHKGMTTIEIDLGYKQELQPAHFVSAIAEASGINGKDIGKINIKDKFSYVDVPTQYVEDIIKSLKSSTIKSYNVHVKKVSESKLERIREDRGSRGNSRSRGDHQSSSRRRDERGSKSRKPRQSTSRGREDRGNRSSRNDRQSSSRGSDNRRSRSRD